jgi:hypothetical protein
MLLEKRLIKRKLKFEYENLSVYKSTFGLHTKLIY